MISRQALWVTELCLPLCAVCCVLCTRRLLGWQFITQVQTGRMQSTYPWPNALLPLLLVVLLLLQGKEYSCYSLAHEGRVVAHADTAAELSNLNYQHCAHPGIKQWVEKFVQASGVSGQVRCTLLPGVMCGCKGVLLV